MVAGVAAAAILANPFSVIARGLDLLNDQTQIEMDQSAEESTLLLEQSSDKSEEIQKLEELSGVTIEQMQQDFQCRYIPPFMEKETPAASLYINIDVRRDASCYPSDWECRPCRIFIIENPTRNFDASNTPVFAAKANLKTGRVSLTREQETRDVRQKAADAVLWLVFDGHDYSDKIRLYKTAGDAEDDCGFYWL